MPVVYTNAIMMEVVDWEDRRWWQAREWVQRYRRQLTPQQIDEKQDTGDPCMNGIGGRQHNVVSNALRHFVWSNFQHAWCETHAWCTCVYLVNDCAFWWEVTVVEAYHSSALQWFTPKCTSSSATHLQSLILNLVYRVVCPLCHQVVLVRRLLMCWLHPQNWLAV